jgi:hypothetical protein
VDLTELKVAIDRGRAAQLAPPATGEVKPWQSIEDSFGDAEWQELHAVVREVGRRAPGTFARFFGEVRIGSWIVEALCDEPDVPTIDWLIEKLEQRATDEGPWLVVTPLAHVESPARYIELSSVAALAEVEQRHDVGFDEEHVSTTMEQWRHLRDRLEPRGRWLPTSRLAPFPIDTGCRSALITVEEGTEGVAINRARTRALLALAVWTLFEAPAWRRMWPSVADWAPTPSFELSTKRKPFEPEVWIGATARTASITHHGPYAPPADRDLLRLPFDAMASATRRSAHVLLSAAWSLFQSRRFPSLLEATDRAFYLSTALAGLCEPPPPQTGGVLARWHHVRDRLDLRAELRDRGYTEAELDVAEERSYRFRNIAAHGGDAALVNLGYPADATRILKGQRTISGDQLAISVLNVDRRPMLWALREAVRLLFLEASRSGWDDQLFERNFAA